MADHHQPEVNTAKNGTKISASSASWSSDDDDDMVVISHPPAATNTTSVYMKRSHDEKKKAQQRSKSPPLVEQAFVRTAVPAPSTTSIPAFTTTHPPLLQKSISSEDDDENDFRHSVEVVDPNKSSQDSAQEVLPTSASPRRLPTRADRQGKHRPANKKTSSIQQTEGATGARTAAAPTSSTTTTTATLQQSKSVDKNDDDDKDYWSVEDDDDGNDHENQQPAATASTLTPVAGTNNAQNNSGGGGGGGGGGRITLSREDIQVCQQLDAEYEQALEEREVGYAARYNSVRQSACFSVAFMLIYLTLGTLFFVRQAAETEAWTVSDSLLFSIYTITTVGYGHLETPETPVFQLYTIFFIFIGIATLTIMVAQVYQCIALEASRAQHSRDQSELARRGMDMLIKTTMLGTVGSSSPTSSMHAAASAAAQGGAGVSGVQRRLSQDDHDMVGISIPPVPWIDRVFRLLERIKIFFVTNELGRSISVLFPFAGLILIGAIVIGPIEGWTPIESIYFAVVSLTTVGFGDYYPTRTASVWFCIVWLPFSIGFMSLFLANVAAFYIRLSDKNIERIERHLRRRIARAKLDAEREKREARRRALRGQEPRRPPASIEMGAATSSAETGRGSFDTDEDSNHGMDDSNHSGSSGGRSRERDLISAQANWTRRDRVLHNSRARAEEGRKMDGNESDDSEETIQPRGSRMATMKAVLETVYANMSQASSNAFRAGPDSEFLSIRSNQKLYKHSLRDSTLRKPSFALRVLVQERLAEIIATEIAGNQNNVEIKDNTLIVTITLLKQSADKWLIPRRARKAFRSVSFEVLYFVGEHGLITRGADALYEDLTPFEFHGLFAPFLAALGDAETMETWLSSTEMLAEVDLRGRDTPSPIQMASQSGKLQQQQQQQPPRHDEHQGARGRTRRGGRRKHDLNVSVDSTEDLPDGHYRPVGSDKHDHTIV